MQVVSVQPAAPGHYTVPMDQELDMKLQSAPATLSTMELKFYAICSEH